MIYFLFVCLNLKVVLAADPPRAIENNRAVKLIEKDQTLEAQTRLQRAVVNHNNYSELHYNLAISYEKNGDVEKAVKEYEIAARMTDDNEMKFQANFNAARLLGENKQIPKALAHYQAALETKPDSTETKTNIELLTQENKGGGGQNNQQNQNQNQGQNKNDQKDGEGDKNKDQQQQPQQTKVKGNQPQEYKAENLSKQDVQKIFEELKRQEDKIRAKISDEKKQKDKSIDKDW